jgi:GT2 family glycosyltransferase
MNQTALTVIIATCNDVDRLRPLCQSLLAQSVAESIQIVVVANLANPSLREFITTCGFQYADTGQIGVNRARNRGLELARGDVVLFIDDDCVLSSPTFLSRHLKWHRDRPEVCGVGGPYELSESAGAIAEAYHWIADHWLMTSRYGADRTLFLVGGNCSFKTKVLKSFGGFNDQILFGGAELDVQIRMTNAGALFIFDENLTIEHRAELSLQSFLYKAFLQGYSADQRRLSELNEEKSFASHLSLTDHVHRYRKLSWRRQILFALYRQAFDIGRWASRTGRNREIKTLDALLFFIEGTLRRGLNLRYHELLNDMYFASRYTLLCQAPAVQSISPEANSLEQQPHNSQ